MVDLFRPGTKPYHAAWRSVEKSQYFDSRRPLLREVRRAQAAGQRYLVINGLLPLVEGVLLDAVFPEAEHPIPARKGVKKLAETETPIAGPIRAAEALLFSAGAGTALFDQYAPPPGVEPRTLNRHGILHGAARRYGTEQNATKLFLLIVLLAECLELRDMAERRKARAQSRRKKA
jgi:hypothetical protein